MSNSNKLQDDAARHRGFVKSGEQAWLEEGEDEWITALGKSWINLSKGGVTFKMPIIDTCFHKETIKKQLLTSFYHVCKDCGKEV